MTNSIAKPVLKRTCLRNIGALLSRARIPTTAPWPDREISKTGSRFTLCKTMLVINKFANYYRKQVAGEKGYVSVGNVRGKKVMHRLAIAREFQCVKILKNFNPAVGSTSTTVALA
ncbi:hypothetical protein PoB_004031600 [Plakobranchus ocellatus]|uniref:Uncharacterized protein n=1 Tax=Plakobranchus ocellatus TaxID=259542 RepID=A0AAV4ARQ2_9GAST|nr:hypothetical protein PoB_004031600 [Plakobranchus ocellatus]